MSLIICPAGSGSGGRSSSWPASYVVREWLASEYKMSTEENVVSKGGYSFVGFSLVLSLCLSFSVRRPLLDLTHWSCVFHLIVTVISFSESGVSVDVTVLPLI